MFWKASAFSPSDSVPIRRIRTGRAADSISPTNPPASFVMDRAMPSPSDVYARRVYGNAVEGTATVIRSPDTVGVTDGRSPADGEICIATTSATVAPVQVSLAIEGRTGIGRIVLQAPVESRDGTTSR